MVRRALPRQTRWCQNRCSTFNIKYFIVQKSFWKFLNFDPGVIRFFGSGQTWGHQGWWPQVWPEPKNDWNDFEMIFRELSNAVFRFVRRSRRSAGAEIDGGGGGVQTPIPSRWWKIQRPIRARVNPRPAGVFSRTRPAGGAYSAPPA